MESSRTYAKRALSHKRRRGRHPNQHTRWVEQIPLDIALHTGAPCPKCSPDKTLPRSAFFKSRFNRNGLQAYCKECMARYKQGMRVRKRAAVVRGGGPMTYDDLKHLDTLHGDEEAYQALKALSESLKGYEHPWRHVFRSFAGVCPYCHTHAAHLYRHSPAHARGNGPYLTGQTVKACSKCLADKELEHHGHA